MTWYWPVWLFASFGVPHFSFSLFSKLQNTYSKLLSPHFCVSNCILVIVSVTTMFILYICLS